MMLMMMMMMMMRLTMLGRKHRYAWRSEKADDEEGKDTNIQTLSEENTIVKQRCVESLKIPP